MMVAGIVNEGVWGYRGHGGIGRYSEILSEYEGKMRG